MCVCRFIDFQDLLGKAEVNNSNNSNDEEGDIWFALTVGEGMRQRGRWVPDWDLQGVRTKGDTRSYRTAETMTSRGGEGFHSECDAWASRRTPIKPPPTGWTAAVPVRTLSARQLIVSSQPPQVLSRRYSSLAGDTILYTVNKGTLNGVTKD